MQSISRAELEKVVSKERFRRYLMESGFDVQYAMKLYLWNTQLGESFFPPIQAVEIALRNRVSSVFSDIYGDEWWKDNVFLQTVGKVGAANIDEVKQRLRRASKPIETDRIIADLSFGFWLNALAGRFNQTVWSMCLRDAFPNLPNVKNRNEVHSVVQRVSDLRNRIFHHEPIFCENVSGHYSRCLNLLFWLSEEKRNWMKPQFRVPKVMRERPKK